MPEYDAFAEIVRAFGRPAHPKPIPPSSLARYQSEVPAGLSRFWRNYGLGSFKNGRFWISEPILMQPVVDAVFNGDVVFAPHDLTLVGYTAFGDLLCWHRHLKSVTVDMNEFKVADVSNPHYRLPETRNFVISDDFDLGGQIENYLQHDDFTTVFDVDGDDLFVKAVERIGTLEDGEVYGIFPPLNFGGEACIGNVRRTPALEHLLFLAQLGPFTLTGLTPQRPGFPFGELIAVRQIGLPRE